jgi:hypothetical protein
MKLKFRSSPNWKLYKTKSKKKKETDFQKKRKTLVFIY